MTKLYEQTELRQITGATLRPGGLELTRRGLELCAFKAGGKVLDIGCGPGESLGLMREMDLEACGLDISEKLLAEAALRGPVILGNAENIPLKDEALDGASMECVLSLVEDKTLALREIWRLLRPGGRLFLSDLFLRKDADQDKNATGCLAGAETLAKLRGLLRNAGFNVLHEIDESKRLVELAANMIFKYGSPEEFFRQWGLGECPCRESRKNLGYVVFVAEKKA